MSAGDIELIESDRLDQRNVRYATVENSRTRLWEGGTGDDIVLVHGGEFGDTYSLDSWSTNLDELSAKFRVVAFDRLGQGFTDNPASAVQYTFEAVMAHIVACIERFAHDETHLVGHSRGGFFAMRVAMDRPDLVRSLTIVDSNTAAPESPAFPSSRFYEELARKYPGPPSPDFVQHEPLLQSYSPRHVTDSFLERLREISQLEKVQEAYQIRANKAAVRWTTSLTHARQESLVRLADEGLHVPVLVAWGRDDPSAPLSLGLDLFDRISAMTAESQLHVFNRAGHYAFREQPRAFNSLVSGFCRDH